MFRKSHLLTRNLTSFYLDKQFTQSDFSFYSWGLTVTVRWSKTIQFRDRIVSVLFSYIPNSPLCPVHAILHAFSFQTKTGKDQAFSYFDHLTLCPKLFTYQKFLAQLRRCLVDIGLEPSHFASHSFHRGGASFAFQAGVPIEMIKILGDWKSDAVLLYLTVPMNMRLHAVDQITRHIMSFNQ